MSAQLLNFPYHRTWLANGVRRAPNAAPVPRCVAGRPIVACASADHPRDLTPGETPAPTRPYAYAPLPSAPFDPRAEDRRVIGGVIAGALVAVLILAPIARVWL